MRVGASLLTATRWRIMAISGTTPTPGHRHERASDFDLPGQVASL